jgi:hypothetical protein
MLHGWSGGGRFLMWIYNCLFEYIYMVFINKSGVGVKLNKHGLA